MNYNKLRTQIDAYIKRNGKQEITGPVLNGVLNAIVDSLASGCLYAGILSPGSELPTPDSNVFMLCGPGDYSVDGSPAKVGIGQLGILSNASGQWKMETVQVVDVLQEVDSDSAQTSPNPASVSATMKFLDSYLKPGNLASIIPDWGGFFSKIDDISNITGPLDFSGTNYLTKEENLKDACVQLDEEVKASNDNIAILGAEAEPRQDQAGQARRRNGHSDRWEHDILHARYQRVRGGAVAPGTAGNGQGKQDLRGSQPRRPR